MKNYSFKTLYQTNKNNLLIFFIAFIFFVSKWLISFIFLNEDYLFTKIIFDSLDNKIDELSYSAFNPATPPSYLENKKLNEIQFIDEAKSLVKNLAENDAFSGTVLIAKGNKVLFEFATAVVVLRLAAAESPPRVSLRHGYLYQH